MKNLSFLFSLIITIGFLTSCQKNQELAQEMNQDIIQATEPTTTEESEILPELDLTDLKEITAVEEYLKEETTPLSIKEGEETAAAADSRNGNFYDNFQYYYTGNISTQSYVWNKWNFNAYFDAQVYRSGGNQYMGVERQAGYANHHQPDVICDFGTKRYGKYEVSFDMWIPFHHSGYFNVQKDLTLHNANNEFGAEVFFYGNESGKVKVGGRNKYFYYSQNTWNRVKLIVDLGRNVTSMYINGYLIHSWYCTDTARGRYGRKQIEGIDFYPYANNSRFYIDRMNLKRIY